MPIPFLSISGYSVCHTGMIYDKRMLYETDIRVPLFIKGPGIAAGYVFTVNLNPCHTYSPVFSSESNFDRHLRC